MANLPEVDQYDAGVYQLETTDPALAGANGIMNTPTKSLVNRARYLLNRMLDGALSFVVDSGTANAIVASLPQPIAALVDGMEVSFRVAASVTGATTLKLTNTGGPTLATLPLYGGDYVALVGGELPAGSTVRAKLNLSLNASNGGAWVIQSVSGGIPRILTAPSGDTSTLAANMAALFNAADGLAAVNVGVGVDVTLTKTQYGAAILKLTGTPTAAINLVLPAQSGQWIIWNQQGGTNNITVKPAGGTGVILPQGNVASIVCSDGAVASFASAQAGQSFLTAVPITGVTGTTLTISGGYTPGAVMLEKNGSLLEPAGSAPDYTATTSPTITLTRAAVSTDTFTLYKFTTFTVANAVQKSGDTMTGPLVLAAGSTVPTPAANDNSQAPANTAWVMGQISGVVGSMRNAVMSVTAAGVSQTWSAKELVVETALGGSRYCVANPSGTINLGTTGAGGMDTGAAPTSGWVALYGIYNPTTSTFNLLAQNVTSAVASEVYSGANMPAGYTASALVAVLPTNSSGQIPILQVRDREVYKIVTTVLSSTSTPSVFTALSISSAVPQNAKKISGTLSINNTTTATVNMQVSGDINGVDRKTIAASNPSTGFSMSTPYDLMLSAAQTMYWASSTNGGTLTSTVEVTRYSI
jgi:hypothetical protein